MNVSNRQLFVLLVFIGLYIFTNGFTSSKNLSVGQGLMLGSIVPASLFLFATVCHTQKHASELVSGMVMLVGIVFALLSYGTYKQTGDLPDGIFAWLGLMICAASVVLMMRSSARAQSA